MNKLIEKLKEIYSKVQPVLFTGKVYVIIKTTSFIAGSVFIGLWLGIKLFFPGDFVLSQINRELFVRDMGLVADNISVSMLGNVTFHNGQFTEKGERIFSFGRIVLRPSFSDLIRKRFGGELIVRDIDNQGGFLNIGISPGNEACYSFKSRDLPLSMFRGFLKDISFAGMMTGEGDICINEEGRQNGSIFLVSDDIVFRGKFPTAMGPIDVGRIDLGSFDFATEIKDGRAEIVRLVSKGIINIDVAGSVNINRRSLMASRLDVDVRISIDDLEKIQEIPALSIMMGLISQYSVQGEEGKFAMIMRGPATKPSINRAPPQRRGDEKSSEAVETKSRAEKVRSRMAARRKSAERPSRRELPETEKDVVAEEREVKSEEDASPKEQAAARPSRRAEPEPEPEPEPEVEPEPEEEVVAEITPAEEESVEPDNDTNEMDDAEEEV